ncbi:hypothetical protein AX16_011006 [Volvariella volvacea WC 439]|nr:hypothetical protein AX16_011006 [Volvariella volvacea WC 439]
MHFTKPSWVVHQDSSKEHNAKRLSIFSVHVHPDGSRIATGGLDAKIRIWSTKPILNPASEGSGKPPKALCTLSMHTGPVLTVRWAHSGRWLASGSDDEIVMIWDLDPNARGKVWGSNEVNVEGWKPLKRLPGHESDVTDVAWSPGDRYLASVGLDSKVIIWCGFTLERITKLDQHQGFVKGVCWDPVGEFLATQSDDRTVKIWRTTDWGLEAEVRKPFEDSPGSTFFRRLSWSPDGAHITASNATNNKGYVFIAAVITRNSWTSEISLVGHENTVEVAAYNPHIFLRNPNSPAVTANICSVVALGADDRSVSIWQTKSARPLIVAKEVFDRQIMDLSWSWDGLTLYAASSDGTLAVFNFTAEELEGIAPHSVQEQYLSKFMFTPPPLPEGYSHTSIPAKPSSTRMTPPLTPPGEPHAQSSTSQQHTDLGHVTASGEHVNVLVAKKGNKNKKRVGLTSASSIPSASTGPSNAPSTITSTQAQHDSNNKGKSPVSFPAPAEQPFESAGTRNENTWPGRYLNNDVPMDLDVDVPISSLDTSGGGAVNPRKRKASPMEGDETRVGKARTLGGDRVREAVTSVKELSGLLSGVGSTSGAVTQAASLPMAPLMNYLKAEVEGTEDVLEARNSENEDSHEVMFVDGRKQTLWLDYLPSPSVAIKATSYFCAVAMLDGTVNVYSPTGRRLMPSLCLGAPCAMMDANKGSLLVITIFGQLYCWNIKKQSSFFPPISISTVLSSPNHTLTSATVRANGSPILACTNGVVYSYDPNLHTFVKLSEKWWGEGSEAWAWSSRQRMSTVVNSSSSANSGKGILALVEGGIVQGESSGAGSSISSSQKPEWWGAAMTLGHLECKLHATKLLDSPQEYRQALLAYAKKVADEGFRGKAEELIKELFGPVYWRPGRDDVWQPTVVGLSKRDLLREVLNVFARSKTLTKLAMDWQDIQKRAVNDEL